MSLHGQAFSRRSFLASGTLAAAELALRQHASAQRAAGPLINFPSSPRQRIAIATYPFRAMILAPTNPDRSAKIPGLDLAGFAHYIRTEFDVFGIEPLHSHFPSTDPSEIRKLKAAFDAVGVRSVNIPVDADIDLTSPDPARRDASYRTLERWVDIAAILQSPSIRIGAVPHGTGPQDVAGPAKALEPLIRYASARNVIICFENDDPVFGTAARIVAVLQQVDTPWLRALPDFANSLMGGDEAFNASAVRSMFRYASNIAHVKDAEVINKVRRTASLKDLFSIAKQAHFRGYYSMESDSDVDPTADTHHLIEQCLVLM